MKSTSASPRILNASVPLFVVLLALPWSASAAESSALRSSPGPSDDLRIIPFDDPRVVGVVRVPTPFGGENSEPDTAETDAATWQSDFAAALDRATREKKVVLLNFTGSDWCGWCHRLEADVFSKSEFKDYAARHLILVKVDFPKKTRLPPNEAAQNTRLQKQFGVRGFPTIIAVDASGVKVAEIRGYVRGGPKAFLATLEKQSRR